MAVEKLRRERVDMLMGIEDDEKSSKLFVCNQEMIDGNEKTGKSFTLYADVMVEHKN